MGKSPEKILRRRKAGLKTGKFGRGFGGLLRRLQEDGQRAMPQLTPNVPEYAKHFSVELFEIDGIDEKNRQKRRNRRKEIDEIDKQIDEKNRRKSTKSPKKLAAMRASFLLFSFVDFVDFVKFFVDFVDFFVNFVDFVVFVKSGGGVIFVAPLFRDFFRTSLRGWGGGWGSGFGVRGVGTVAPRAGEQCAATKTPRKDTAQGRFCEGFALGAPFPALWA